MSFEKIVLEYDEETGEVRDANGVHVGFNMVIKGFEPEKPKTDVSALVSMKDAGFTAEEIMQMKREGLV